MWKWKTWKIITQPEAERVIIKKPTSGFERSLQEKSQRAFQPRGIHQSARFIYQNSTHPVTHLQKCVKINIQLSYVLKALFKDKAWGWDSKRDSEQEHSAALFSNNDCVGITSCSWRSSPWRNSNKPEVHWLQTSSS